MQVCRGGDEISFTNMGLVAEMVLAQLCVRLVSSFVGRLAQPSSLSAERLSATLTEGFRDFPQL